MQKVSIFTDGSCLHMAGVGYGPGGYGAIIRINNQDRELSAGYELTTNNRMELMAVIEAISALDEPSKVIIMTDSQYVRNGVQEWVRKWKTNNWKTSNKKPVKNQDLWRRLDELCEGKGHQIIWQWIRGHAGHTENERCDQLAKEAAGSSQKIRDEGFEPAS